MLIDNTLLDQLTGQAKASPRLRQHYDLRDSSDDESQRMLNAIEPGTVIPIHRHTQTSEDVPYIIKLYIRCYGYEKGISGGLPERVDGFIGR